MSLVGWSNKFVHERLWDAEDGKNHLAMKIVSVPNNNAPDMTLVSAVSTQNKKHVHNDVAIIQQSCHRLTFSPQVEMSDMPSTRFLSTNSMRFDQVDDITVHNETERSSCHESGMFSDTTQRVIDEVLVELSEDLDCHGRFQVCQYPGEKENLDTPRSESFKHASHHNIYTSHSSHHAFSQSLLESWNLIARTDDQTNNSMLRRRTLQDTVKTTPCSLEATSQAWGHVSDQQKIPSYHPHEPPNNCKLHRSQPEVHTTTT